MGDVRIRQNTKGLQPTKNEWIEYTVCVHIIEDSRSGGIIKSKMETEVNPWQWNQSTWNFKNTKGRVKKSHILSQIKKMRGNFSPSPSPLPIKGDTLCQWSSPVKGPLPIKLSFDKAAKNIRMLQKNLICLMMCCLMMRPLSQKCYM